MHKTADERDAGSRVASGRVLRSDVRTLALQQELACVCSEDDQRRDAASLFLSCLVPGQTRTSPRPVRLSLSAKSVSYLVVFFSHNKSANSTFSYGLSVKRIGRQYPAWKYSLRFGVTPKSRGRLVPHQQRLHPFGLPTSW
jgi:hypothetical protein